MGSNPLTYNDYVSLRRVQDDQINVQFRSVNAEFERVHNDIKEIRADIQEIRASQRRTDAILRNSMARRFHSRIVSSPKYDYSRPEAGVTYPDEKMFPQTLGQLHLLRRPMSERQKAIVRYLTQFYDVTLPTRGTNHGRESSSGNGSDSDSDSDSNNGEDQTDVYETAVNALAEILGVDTDRLPPLPDFYAQPAAAASRPRTAAHPTHRRRRPHAHA